MAKGKRGRPRQSGARDKRGRLIHETRVEAPEHIVRLREQFGFVSPTKGPEGREGTIDQDICDGIGQLHALGLLDGHGHDAQDLRDHGRRWRDGYATILRKSGYTCGEIDRAPKGVSVAHYTHQDAKWDAMDEALNGFERSALRSLLIDPVVGSWPDGETESPWVRALVAEGLLAKGKVVKFCRFPDSNDRELLAAAIRGLCILIDASLPSRWERTGDLVRSAA
jgi:hypothetical protein